MPPINQQHRHDNSRRLPLAGRLYFAAASQRGRGASPVPQIQMAGETPCLYGPALAFGYLCAGPLVHFRMGPPVRRLVKREDIMSEAPFGRTAAASIAESPWHTYVISKPTKRIACGGGPRGFGSFRIWV